jgi:hypothetical protein
MANYWDTPHHYVVCSHADVVGIPSTVALRSDLRAIPPNHLLLVLTYLRRQLHLFESQQKLNDLFRDSDKELANDFEKAMKMSKDVKFSKLKAVF